MSNAQGEVFTETGSLYGYFLYGGTGDVCYSQLYQSAEELSDHWGDQFYTPAKRCVHTHTLTHMPVTLYSSYGGGFHWPGEICFICQVITDGFMPQNLPVVCHCAPDVPPFMCMCECDWPKDGYPEGAHCVVRMIEGRYTH